MTRRLTRRVFGGLIAAVPALGGQVGAEPDAPAPPLRPISPWYGWVIAVKAAHPQALVLFGTGQSFEIYGVDAQRAAPVMDVTLTRRGCLPDGTPWHMCGVPSWLNPDGPVGSWLYPDARRYLGPLQAAGFEVLLWRREPGSGPRGTVMQAGAAV